MRFTGPECEFEPGVSGEMERGVKRRALYDYDCDGRRQKGGKVAFVGGLENAWKRCRALQLHGLQGRRIESQRFEDGWSHFHCFDRSGYGGGAQAGI